MSTRVRATLSGRCGGWALGACVAIGAGAIGGCANQQGAVPSELPESVVADQSELAEQSVFADAADLVEPVVVGAADFGESVVVGAVGVGESVVVGAADLGRGFVNLLLLDGDSRARKPAYSGPSAGWSFPNFSFGQ